MKKNNALSEKQIKTNTPSPTFPHYFKICTHVVCQSYALHAPFSIQSVSVRSILLRMHRSGSRNFRRGIFPDYEYIMARDQQNRGWDAGWTDLLRYTAPAVKPPLNWRLILSRAYFLSPLGLVFPQPNLTYTLNGLYPQMPLSKGCVVTLDFFQTKDPLYIRHL